MDVPAPTAWPQREAVLPQKLPAELMGIAVRVMWEILDRRSLTACAGAERLRMLTETELWACAK